MQTKGKITAFGVVVLIIGYVGTYVVLSSGGVYVPYTAGLSGVKDWAWAPKGFSDNAAALQLESNKVRFFYPIWWFDSHYWHTDHVAPSGPRHPAAPP